MTPWVIVTDSDFYLIPTPKGVFENHFVTYVEEDNLIELRESLAKRIKEGMKFNFQDITLKNANDDKKVETMIILYELK
jgi:hypothetical protein